MYDPYNTLIIIFTDKTKYSMPFRGGIRQVVEYLNRMDFKFEHHKINTIPYEKL